MISAKLIQSLEKEGFSLDFPLYSSNDERIIEILKENNDRLLLALPLLLQYEFDYQKIIKKINKDNLQKFNKIIQITHRIFQREKISKNPNRSRAAGLSEIKQGIFTHENGSQQSCGILDPFSLNNADLKNIIKQHSLQTKISAAEFDYYYASFKEFQNNKMKSEEKTLTKQIAIRGTLNLNQALTKIYSPGKQIIMVKIFNHESLSNTELKYYYRSIRPLILAILNDNLQNYLRLIESMKKYS